MMFMSKEGWLSEVVVVNDLDGDGDSYMPSSAGSKSHYLVD